MGHDEGGAELENPYAAPRWMPHEAKVVAGDSVPLEEIKPFRTIWTRPRDTIRWIVATNPQLHVMLLICLAGIGEALDRASLRNAGDAVPLWVIIALAVGLGPLSGLISVWISSHLLRFTGAWIGGVASRQHLTAAIAWASVPTIFSMPLWIPQLLLFGRETFTSTTPLLDSQPMLGTVLVVLGLAETVFGIWSLVLLCNTIAEVQGFRSAWAGLGNLILAGAVIFVPLIAIIFTVVLMSQI